MKKSQAKKITSPHQETRGDSLRLAHHKVKPDGVHFICKYCLDKIASNQSSIKVPNPLKDNYGTWHLDCWNIKQADDSIRGNENWGKLI